MVRCTSTTLYARTRAKWSFRFKRNLESSSAREDFSQLFDFIEQTINTRGRVKGEFLWSRIYFIITRKRQIPLLFPLCILISHFPNADARWTYTQDFSFVPIVTRRTRTHTSVFVLECHSIPTTLNFASHASKKLFNVKLKWKQQKYEYKSPNFHRHFLGSGIMCLLSWDFHHLPCKFSSFNQFLICAGWIVKWSRLPISIQVESEKRTT